MIRGLVHHPLGRLLLCVGVFFVLGGAWVERSWVSVPRDETVDDAFLILWVLDWVRHALGTTPTLLFDPPVNHPAPHQLSGSEHFLASQLLFAPLYALMESAVAAANLTALLSYGLAAAAMDALLRALGVGAWAAFLGGVAYAFGYDAAPGRLHILQSQHLFLPLAALALHRLRARAGAPRAMAFAAVLLAGGLSSYHMAVYLTVGMAVWGCAELARDGRGRAPYVAWAVAATAVALGILVVVSMPYLSRPEAQGDVTLSISRWRTSHLEGGHVDAVARSMPWTLLLRIYAGCLLEGGLRPGCIPVDALATRWRDDWTFGIGPVAVLQPALVLLGLLAAARRRTGARWLVGTGVLFVLAGAMLSGPEYAAVGGVEIPLPRAFLAESPARFIRAPHRALVLSFFGGTLAVACGLDLLLRRLGRGAAVGGLLALLVLAMRLPAADPLPGAGPLGRVARWSRFSPYGYLDNPALGPDAASYAEVARTVEQAGSGPLLDLPPSRDGTVVVGQMLHRQPSIAFYSGYVPPHVSIVHRAIARLPDAGALDDLVDMTGLTWIVLRDDPAWPQPADRRALADALRSHPRVRAVRPAGRFTLVELDRTSKHPQWFRGIQAGPRRDVSPLGTPLAPLPDVPEQATLEMDVAPRLQSGRLTSIRSVLHNRGPSAWAAAVPERPGRPLTVRLELRWLAPSGTVLSESVHELLRDVPAGEDLVQPILAVAPKTLGRSRVVVRLLQVDGTDLTSSRNPVAATVEVAASSERASAPTAASP